MLIVLACCVLCVVMVLAVGCSLFVVCCLLLVVRCVLSAVCYALFVARCCAALPVVLCSLVVAC